MIYLGKARIITDVFMRLERGDIVDLYGYEDGEEDQEGLPGTDPSRADYVIEPGSIDAYSHEVELITETPEL